MPGSAASAEKNPDRIGPDPITPAELRLRGLPGKTRFNQHTIKLRQNDRGISGRAWQKGGSGVPDEEYPVLSRKALEEELKNEHLKKTFLFALQRTLYLLLVVAAVVVIISVLFLPIIRISGASMSDTLEDGDLVVAVNNHKFKTGDVIGFNFNNSVLIKRVIATSGDWVDLDADGNVYVNGRMLDEPYVTEKSIGECNIVLPYQVPDGRCFVLGDHRATSIDSRNRSVGCISNDAVVGRLLWRIWPMESIGNIH